MYDPERYRDKEEVDAWRQRDPIAQFGANLTDTGVLTEADIEQIEVQVRAEVDDAVAFAEAGTLEPVEDLLRFVHSEARP
jgi:TPP-dependent pyruvate/acetoin dehydrogenase alpha subunit